MNSNDDDDQTDLIQYQDSQGRWYELFSPTEVLAGQLQQEDKTSIVSQNVKYIDHSNLYIEETLFVLVAW